MAKVGRDLRDDEIIRFLRFSVTESAAATFTQQSYDTQLSIDRGYIWMIHWIEAQINPNKLEMPAANDIETVSLQIARESQAAMHDLNNPDIIAYTEMQIKRSAAIGTDAGPLWVDWHSPIKTEYPIPLPYAAQEIHVGLVTSHASVQTINGRIAYTLRRVSDKFFYRVAQALIS